MSLLSYKNSRNFIFHCVLLFVSYISLIFPWNATMIFSNCIPHKNAKTKAKSMLVIENMIYSIPSLPFVATLFSGL